MLEAPNRSNAPFEVQYEAAMKAAVIFDRSRIVRIAVTGADRETFLHNMLSQDVKGISVGHGAEATFLTNKGRLVSDLTLHKEDERIWIELDEDRAEPLETALSRYIISEDVTLERPTDDDAISIEGPDASGLLPETTRLDELAHLESVVFEDLRITAKRRDPSPRFDIAGNADRIAALAEQARDNGAVVGGVELAETRRIECGRPQFGVDMDDANLPLEAGLDAAVHFDKGCYIGQEYVVRLAHRGQLNKKLVGIRIDTVAPPEPGTPVTHEGREAGAITSARFSPGVGAVVALGYLKREFFDPDTRVTVDGHDGAVTALPFLPPA